MDVAAGKDADGGGEDVEWGAGDGDQAIGARIGVVASGGDTQPRGSQFEFPDRSIHDALVRVFAIPIPDVGLLHQQPEGFPLQVRRGRQRVPGTIIGFPPTEFRILAVPFNAWATPEDRAMGELEAQLTRSTGFP